jgi:hypothetical protein
LITSAAGWQSAEAKEADAASKAAASELDAAPAAEDAAPTAEETTATDEDAEAADPSTAVDIFAAIDEGQADVTFIAKNDHAARVIVVNKTKQPLHLRMPPAFAGVPVLAQFGGGGGGLGRGGGLGGGGGQFGGGGGQQSLGGGGGFGGGGLGGGGGGFGGGGGGGFFSVPPEKTIKINLAMLCLDHGLRDPSSSRPYRMVPILDHVQRPEVIELLKAFGRGELQHDAAQAAAWHLNSGVSWGELSAKLTGTRRSFTRAPYFSADEIRAGMAYAGEAMRLAQLNADEYRRAIAEHRESKIKSQDSDSRKKSTVEEEAPEEASAASESEIEPASDQTSATTIE